MATDGVLRPMRNVSDPSNDVSGNSSDSESDDINTNRRSNIIMIMKSMSMERNRK